MVILSWWHNGCNNLHKSLFIYLQCQVHGQDLVKKILET